MGILIATVLFILQLFLVPGTGLTWDEPSSFFFGRANLKFWMTGDRGYVTDYKNPNRFKTDPIKYVYGEDVYPPFPFLVTSAFSYVLSEKLHLLNTIDAHHVGEVVIGAIGVGFFYYLLLEFGFTKRIAGLTTGIFALYPTIFGQMRDDAKDIPLMSMFVISMYWFVRWAKQETRGMRHETGKLIIPTLLFILFFGLTLATKPTAVMLVPIVITWIILSVRNFGVFLKFCVLSSLAVLVMVAAWPWLWDDPVGKLSASWDFFKVVGYRMPLLYYGKMYWAGVDVPKGYPFGILILQTPLEITLLSILGTLVGLYRVVKKRDPWALLVLIWFWGAMARFYLPGVIIYARIRHFIDAMPAFFILVGYGLSWLYELLATNYKLRARRIPFNPVLLLGILILLHETVVISRLYPYEPSYFNILVGGAKGVADNHTFDIEYWAEGVKEAIEYINSHEPQARVYTCGLSHLAHFYAKGSTKIVVDGSGANYVIIPNSPSFFGGPLDFHSKNDTMIHTVARDGADMYFVFKRTSSAWWNCGYETETNTFSYLPDLQ